MALTSWMLANINDDNDEKESIDELQKLFNIDTAWLQFLDLSQTDILYLKNIYLTIKAERQTKIVYPSEEFVHKWSYMCKPSEVKLVILGQDPYCDGRGTGIAFATLPNVDVPQSLKVIYKELERTVKFNIPQHGCLDSWCKQGVLLLNSIFTVVHGKPMSHEHVGWQYLSNKIIQKLSFNKNNLIFCLWGIHAQKLKKNIDPKKHLILESAHPSPRAIMSQKPFLGNNHFLLSNKYLQQNGLCPINWNVLQ